MADNANQRETIRCSCCKKKFYEEGFKVNRLGQRLKTCLECQGKRGSQYYLFLQGALLKYNLSPEDLDEYVYVGSDENGSGSEYFRMKCPGEEPPKKVTTCVCGHLIHHNHFIRRMATGHTIVTGSCCRRKFIALNGKTCSDCGAPHSNRKDDHCLSCRLKHTAPPPAKKTCQDCGAPHSNRKDNRCKTCRIGKCEVCGTCVEPRFKKCYGCYTTNAVRKPAAPPPKSSCECAARPPTNTLPCRHCWEMAV